MSYSINKISDKKEILDFKAFYNRIKNLKIAEGTDTYNEGDLIFKSEFIFALEDNEIMQEVEVEIDVPDEPQPIPDIESDEQETEEQEQTYHKETTTVYRPEIDPDYEARHLEEVKAQKYEEALQKAYSFEQEGTVEYKNCVFEMSNSNRKNLSDTEEALKLRGEDSTTWNDKNDKLVTLTIEDIQFIRLNLILTRIQKLWIEQFPMYKAQITEATTAEEVEKIVIDYSKEV